MLSDIRLMFWSDCKDKMRFVTLLRNSSKAFYVNLEWRPVATIQFSSFSAVKKMIYGHNNYF